MHRKLQILAFAALALAWLATPALAAGSMGRITRIDAASRTFTLGEGKDARDYSLGSTAKVLKGTRAISLSTLKVGDEVRVDYSERGGKRVASRVAMEKSAAHKASKKY